MTNTGDAENNGQRSRELFSEERTFLGPKTGQFRCNFSSSDEDRHDEGEHTAHMQFAQGYCTIRVRIGCIFFRACSCFQLIPNLNIALRVHTSDP